jgi:hypothetical protein
MTSPDRRAELATLAGVDPAQLRELKESLVDTLLRKGVLVALHIGRWRGKHKLSPEDLGLDAEHTGAVLRTIELGHKLLLPRDTLDELSRLESAGRAALAKYALDTRIGAFLPADNLPKFLEAHDRIQAQYLAIRDELVDRADWLRDEARARFRAAAVELYRATRSVQQVPEPEFVETYVSRSLKLWPGAEQIRASFYFDWEAFYVPLSSELAQEQARLAEISRDQEIRAELAQRTADRYRRTVDDFLTGLVSNLRETVHATVSHALDAIKRGGTPAPQTVGSLRALIDRIRTLNVYGDTDIDSQLDRLSQVLGPRKRAAPINVPQLEAVLVDLRKTCQDAVDQTLNIDPLLTRFAALDVGRRDGSEPAVPQEALR